ncbi:hypothetical protein K501DRAFT_283966 [Backusella circina FSU 941]|nr:hypothetical protein K501DRAFT_283966 [Backusella circina FSU 941]
MSADYDEDVWFQPKQVNHPVNAVHVNETIFVYALYFPFHFSHFLYNGLLPLYSTMLDHDALPTSWTLRAATLGNKHTPTEMILPSGKDIVLERADVSSPKQMLAPYKPMCFSKAIVGTGNRCSLSYCHGQIPNQHYQSFKDYVFTQPYAQDNHCQASRTVYKPEGQFLVGILNRKSTRHITNIPHLITALTSLNKDSDGIDYAVVTIDFEKGCDIISTAHVVKDLDILIAPFGNGLGAGLFMKEDATLVSISARYYSEDWFKYPMTGIGRRIFDFQCDSGQCQEYEQDKAARILKDMAGVTLNQTEMMTFMTDPYPKDLLLNYLPEDQVHLPIIQYQKDVSRRIDVDAFIPWLKGVMDRKPLTNTSFPESCKEENVCCDGKCKTALDRNIFGDNNAWK